MTMELGAIVVYTVAKTAAALNRPVAFAAFESANPVVGAGAAQVKKILEKNDGDFPDIACHIPGNPPDTVRHPSNATG